ncbi:PAS domain S-box protein [candidate division WOR-3 bacterium]|nr:PAS domain S-box protein [candidate division WOR-3 bacterium]
MKERIPPAKTGHIVSVSFLLGVLFWIVDSIFSYLIFHPGNSFLDLLALNIPPYVLYVRTAFILACLAGGVVASGFLRKQRESEVSLRESEKKYRLLAENTLDCIWQMGIDFKFTYVNPSVLQMFGFAQEEWIGSLLSDHCSPENMEFMLDLAKEEIKKGKESTGVKFETYLLHKNDKEIAVEVTTKILFDKNENPIGLQGTTREITERKQAQQALQKSHDELELRVKERTVELVASNKELEAFAYSISHDLQAPLRAISGFSEILLKDYLNTLDDQGQHYLQRVGAGAVNMSQMIEDLLNLSRIGRRPINKKRVDLEELVKETYKLLSEAERKDRKIDFTIKPCPPILADPQLLKIVLTNLFSNALKFTRKCKKAEIKFGCKTEDKKTIFYIKDNGIGFDMKYADKLFGSFQRLHRKEEYEGSGIGLATVQRIIHRHGRKIWAESLPGSGTTFYFTL